MQQFETNIVDNPAYVIMANLSADTVCDLISSKSFHSVRVATNLCNLFYVGVEPNHFAEALRVNCFGERFTCTIVPIKNKVVLYVDESLQSQNVPF